MTATNKINEPEDSESEELYSYEENLQDTDMEAYIQLNKALDEISNCLDALEQKNDSLHAEITKLLEESRQIRSEIKKSESSS